MLSRNKHFPRAVFCFHRYKYIAVALIVAFSLAIPAAWSDDQSGNLAQDIRKIDAESKAGLGVYIKHLGTGEVVNYKADRLWYLASTIKVPLAVAVLQAVEGNQFSLQDQLVLKRSDYVDGAGDLLQQKTGSTYSLSELLEKSIRHSDSTATDMLIRHLGEQAFNDRVRESMVATGFRPMTTILQVRYDAYAELHPRAAELSNSDFMELRSAGAPDARVRAFQRKLGLDRDQLKTSSLEQAFAHYYERELNSATLVAFGLLLERLVQGELLNDEHTELLLGHMQAISTGDKRFSAGLPDNIVFAQKTGTQIQRACNVGVVLPPGDKNAVVVVACAEKFDNLRHAEQAFQKIAGALHRNGWLGGDEETQISR